MKIIETCKWLSDVAQEALGTKGLCSMEGKGKGGSKCAHQDSAYAALRTLFTFIELRAPSLGSTPHKTIDAP